MKKARAETAERQKTLDAEIAKLQQQAAILQQKLQDRSQILSAMPVREQELAELVRSNENARSQYQSLLAKKHDSELANSLESRKQGERFTVLNYATLPRSPQGRSRIVGMGWILGVFCGIGLLFLSEQTDGRIHSQSDLDECTTLPLLARLPQIRSAREQTRQIWGYGFEIALATLLLAVSAATIAHTLLGG